MTPEQESHLEDIKRWMCERLDKKYRSGVAEHGGNLWQKPFIFEMLLDEITDLITYAHVHQMHLKDPSLVNPNLAESKPDEILDNSIPEDL